MNLVEYQHFGACVKITPSVSEVSSEIKLYLNNTFFRMKNYRI